MHDESTNCLIVIPWELHNVGGVTQVVLNLLREFTARRDIRPSLLINIYGHDSLDGQPASTNPHPSYTLTVRNPVTKRGNLRTLFSYFFHLPGTIRRLRRLIREASIDAVNLHYPSLAALSFAIACRTSRRRVRLVLSFHGADFDQAEAASGLQRFAWLAAFRQANHIVACSSALAHRMTSRYPVLKPKMHVAHAGVDQGLLRELGDRGQLPPELEGRDYLFNAATLEPKKGQDVLLRAFADIAPAYPDLVLAVMGRTASALETLQNLATDLGIADRVFIWTDVPHEHVIATMRGARIFVLPSRIEPFGIVSLEAATFKVPVIATNVGGIPEIIVPGQTGLLVEPDDVRQLRDALVRLLDDREFSKTLATKLHDVVADRFTWERTSDLYRHLYANQGPVKSNALTG